jgi:iron complex outermembrane recepter protein
MSRAALLCALHIYMCAEPAHAQRAAENAVKTAEDAFGVTIGRETLGLYTTSSVRGFSPTVAGNARIDGLYFDQVWALNSRLRRFTTIRVGPSAHSYPFPAPTGIVDQAFKTPGEERSISLLVAGDEWGSGSVEADAVLPLLPDKLSFGVGAAAVEEDFYNGTSASYANAGASIRWNPIDSVEIVPFGARSEARDDEFGPIYVPGGAYLPPRVERRRFDGPNWAVYDSTAINYGVLAGYTPESPWRVRLGIFRSLFDDRSVYANLLLNQQLDGTAEQLIVADPPVRSESTSGELRATRSISESGRLHLVHLSLRARDRMRRYGGSDTLDLGVTTRGEPVTLPKPDFEFGPQTHDHIRQQTAGIAYELRWEKRGQIGLGVQRTFYEKKVDAPTFVATTEDEPWLYNFALAYALSDATTVYASYARGLEESGIAPAAASNRDEALPAIRTRQADAGVRHAITPSVKLLAGVFDVTKPYFTLDGARRFTALGDVTHRGVEVSLSGQVARGFNIVTGALLMDPKVEGPDVERGEVGARPVGQAKRTLLLNADWQPGFFDRLSFDLAVRHTSRTPATRDNAVHLPAQTLIDVGARYRFFIGTAPAVLRLSLTNLTDEYSYELRGSGAYDLIPGRRASGYVTIDW